MVTIVDFGAFLGRRLKMTMALKDRVKVILNYLLYLLAENQIIRNEFNGYPSYTHITWVGTSWFIKRKLPQPILYEYKLGSY